MSTVNADNIKSANQYYPKPVYYNTLVPYQIAPHGGIQYLVCRDFNHISRYKGLRQLAHNYNDNATRFVTLETPNQVSSNAECKYYDVPYTEVNRLDIISNKFYGTPNYSWVIAYVNGIEDGFTVREGQHLKIPNSITNLFNKGELLAAIPPLQLNLGVE